MKTNLTVFLSVLFIFVGLFRELRTYAEITDETKEKITTGLEFAEQFVTALGGEGETKKALKLLLKGIGPWLGAVGGLASFVLVFIDSESEELQFMKEKFKEVNNKLDTLSLEFQDVKRLIDWNAVKISFAQYEHKIKAAQGNLKRVYGRDTKNEIDQEKENFIIQYESDYQSSGIKLYQGMIDDDQLFANNLMRAAAKYTEFHQRKLMKFCLGVSQLLTQASAVEVQYYTLKGWVTEGLIEGWVENFEQVGKQCDKYKMESEEKFWSQYPNEINNLLTKYASKSREEIASQIYTAMTDKYEWRVWCVLVYDDIYGFDNHAFNEVCDPRKDLVFKLHENDMNWIVANSPKDVIFPDIFTNSTVDKVAEALKTDLCNPELLSEKYLRKAAVLILDKLKAAGIAECQPYKLVAAINDKSGLVAKISSGRAYRKKEVHHKKWPDNFVCPFSHSYDIIVFN